MSLAALIANKLRKDPTNIPDSSNNKLMIPQQDDKAVSDKDKHCTHLPTELNSVIEGNIKIHRTAVLQPEDRN